MADPQNPSSDTTARLTRRERLSDRIPVRIRTFMWAAGIFMGFGVVVAIMAGVFVDRMQKQMVDVAQAEVDRVAQRAASQMETIIAGHAAAGQQIDQLSDVAFDPQIKAEFELLTREKDVLLSVVIDSDGNCIYYSGRQDDLHNCPQKRTGNRYEGAVMPPGSEEPLFVRFNVRGLPEGVEERKVPVMHAGKAIGYIGYGIEDSAALRSLEPISRHISTSLMWMTAAIILFSGLAIYLLTRIANRHGLLQRRHDEAQHLANIGTMASGLAHEIRNPLHAMNLRLDAAREELEDPRGDTAQHALSTVTNVQTQIASLSQTLTSFMNFALPTKLEQEPVRLKALSGEVGNLLEPEFDSRRVRFERDVPEDAWIHADPTLVRQVLVNVLLNAAQAMESTEGERVIRLTAHHESHRWAVMIEDNGPGLPSGKEDAVFEVFFSARKGGTGFGLAIARRIMEAHGGTIHAQTRPEGGARFMLLFPACKAPATGEQAAASTLLRTEPETIG